MEYKNNCLECGKPLVAQGETRMNGKIRSDWKERPRHVSCYKKYMQRKELEDRLIKLQKRYLNN